MASACLKEMRLNGEVVQSNVVYPTDLGDRATETFGPLSRGEDDGCTLTDLKLQIIDDEVAVPSVEGFEFWCSAKRKHSGMIPLLKAMRVCAVWRNGMVFK